MVEIVVPYASHSGTQGQSPLTQAERQSPPVILKVVPQGRVNGVVVVTALLLARQCVTLEKVLKRKVVALSCITTNHTHIHNN
jgi:hypothetical protein